MPWRSTESRYCGNVSKSHGTPASSVARLMSSTCCSVRESSARCSGRHGAIEKPQLPAITDVTPWYDDGVNDGIPEDLRVVVRVDVDEPGRDDLPRRVELAGTREPVADLGDHAVGDRDIGRPSRRPRPVDDGATPDHHVWRHRSPYYMVACLLRSARGSRPFPG